MSNLDLRSIEELTQELPGPIAIFGAGGFIGANLAHQLSKTRADVYAITHQSFTPWRLIDLPQGCVIRCDINNKDEVSETFLTYKFQTVLFFAAYGAYSKQSNTALIYETNIGGLLNVVLNAQEFGVQAFVHAGSQSEYGLNCSGSKEDSLLLPNSHYAVSKVSASYLIKYLGEQQQFPIVNLRLYSAYGPWEEPDRLIPALIGNGLKKQYPPLVHPDISRDFVYVDDIVRATLLAAIHATKSAKGASINVASGTKTTIRDVAECSRELFNIQEPPAWGSMPNRQWDLQEWYGDPSFAEKTLRWKAVVPFKEGLRKTIEWFETNQAIPKVHQPVDIASPVRISAIIACYLDAQAIPIMHKRLTDTFRSMQVEYEIIFVNDASPDNTKQVLHDICMKDNRVIAIEHSRNFGSQSAFLSGMHVSSGNAVVLMDGDLQDPPELIPEFFEQWYKGGYEVVYGRRVCRETTWFMAIAYKAFYRIFRGLADIKIPVDAGDFSMMDRKVVNQLLLLPETDQFLRGLRAWVGFRQTGVDYVRPERMFGVSTNNLRKNLKWARKGIFSFSYAPLEFLMYGGVIFMVLAFLGLCVTIALRFLDPSVPRGFTAVITLVLGFGGLQLFATSIVGEYVGKVLDETKKRPKYIVRSILAGGDEKTSVNQVKEFLDLRARGRDIGY